MVSVHPSARDYYIALRNIRLSYQSGGSEQTRTRQEPPITPEHSEVNRNLHTMDGDHLEPNMLSPLIRSWDAEIGDIMFPAQFLQELDEGLLLPNLF